MQKQSVRTSFLIVGEEKEHRKRHIDSQAESIVIGNERIRRSPDARFTASAKTEDGALHGKETKAHGGNHDERFEALMSGHQQDHGESNEQDLADAHPFELRIQHMSLEERNLHGMEKRDAKPHP